MAIDFTLTPLQRELQLASRRFARDVLAGAREAESLPTPEQRVKQRRTKSCDSALLLNFSRR